MKDIIRAFSAQQLKMKNSWAWKVSLLAPLLAAGINFLIFYFKGEEIIEATSKGAWTSYANFSTGMVFLLLLPLFLIMLNLLINQLDHQANSRKQLYATPTPRWAQFTAQWLNVTLLFAVAVLLYLVYLLAGGFVLNWVYPDLGFQSNYPDNNFYLKIFNGFLGSLSVLSFQFLLSYYFKNMIVPMGIGMAGFVSYLFITRWEYIHYHPFSYAVEAMRKDGKLVFDYFNHGIFYSLLLTAVLFLVGIFYLRKVKTI